MSDFDFDELDKAVAGVIGPEESTSQDTPTDAATPAPETPAPVLSTPQEQSRDEVTVQQRTSLAPAARRSSGRFMDVVHPSSDMRTRTGYTSAAEAPAPSRPTTFVAPVAEEAKEEDWSKPLESPFLPDAKVEKRPLGGAGPAPVFNPEELLEAPEDELLLEEPDEPRLEAMTLPDPIDFALQTSQDSANDETPELPLEDELSQETIDTAEFDTTPEVTPEDNSQVVGDEILFEESVIEQPTAPETQPVVAEPEPVATPEQPVGPTSISQQYQERPSEAQASGAIYDTENYHQPMTPAPKKHSSAWSIVWIILLVILGAGAGVAFYLFVLPML